ncbi:MAG: hypothetical protein A2Y39_03895 [Candidatus Delongbacteria bacterium GWF2_40_14]|nr:MAG: hypothetical protein A2Y39_03895 [Candidatus Delongbacteria bacterium GWF2_40_14]
MKMRTLKNNLSKNIGRGRNLFLLLFFIIITGCSSSSKFTLFYSGNLNGAIENCRCPKVSEGSILNHITFYKDSIRNRCETLDVSTGNIFSVNSSQKENQLIIPLLDSLNYDLFSPGRNDLDFISEVGNNPVVSMNIKNSISFKKYDFRGLRISVTGMTDYSYSRFNNKNIITEKDIDQISGFTDSLKAFSDIIIFVSNLEAEFEKKVFNQVKNIDIMISGTNSGNEFFLFGNKVYISPGSSPEFIGKLEVEKKEDRIIYNNKFEQMKFSLIKEDDNAKQLIDSLKIKYGIRKNNGSIEEDL